MILQNWWKQVLLSASVFDISVPANTYISWNYPPPSNSHQQEYSIFRRESQPKPSFVTGILGGGVDQTYIRILHGAPGHGRVLAYEPGGTFPCFARSLPR